MGRDLDIFEGMSEASEATERLLGDFEMPNQYIPNLDEYSRIVLFHSGGKDSMSCMLYLLELGIPAHRIELHHHEVDGENPEHLMDYPSTHNYMEKVAEAFGMPLFFSFRVGGFEREMLRENSGTAPITFTRGDGTVVTMGGERSKQSTRRKFPQVTADLRTRWCSGVLKIDVGSRLLINDPRFTEGKTLVISGERAEESTNRARYSEFEPHRADNRDGRIPRWIDHWRPVHKWTERQVWQLIKKWKVTPHAAYWIGAGRASCLLCIFGSSNQWATVRMIAPEQFMRVANYETEFGYTIHRSLSVIEKADRGVPFEAALRWKHLAMSKTFDMPIFTENWILPAGAFGESCGPS